MTRRYEKGKYFLFLQGDTTIQFEPRCIKKWNMLHQTKNDVARRVVHLEPYMELKRLIEGQLNYEGAPSSKVLMLHTKEHFMIEELMAKIA